MISPTHDEFPPGYGQILYLGVKPVFRSCKPHRVLVRNKFLRHGGARDQFCYMDELMNATSVSLVNWFIPRFFNLMNYVKR